MALIAVISVATLGVLWISSTISQFESESQAARSIYLQEQKSLLKGEVDRAYNFVTYMQSQTEKRLTDAIKNRTYEAYALAKNLYETERGTRTTEELKAIIREALRPIRFNNGRGYYFVFNLEGVEILLPISPEMEGKNMMAVKGGKDELVIPETLALVREKGEGFYKYYWPKPNQEGYFPKIAFVKLFEPLGWVIGTGEYLDDVESDIQKECLEWISKIRFGEGGYVFAGQWGGVSLSGPQTGRNMWDVEDVNGVKIVQELIRAARSGGGFVEYVMPKFESQKHAPKLSYAVGVLQWEWYIGAGKYVDEIESAIALQQARLNQRIRLNIRNTVLVLLGVLAIIFLFVKILFNQLKSSLDEFGLFFNRAATDAAQINPKGLYFSEFSRLADAANQMVDLRRHAEKALRESEEKYRSLFELSNEGILLIKDVIFDCNKAACHILKYDKAGLMGKTLAGISPPILNSGIEAVEAQNEIFKAAYAGEPQIFEWQCYRKDGSIVELDFTISVITFGGEQFLLASCRDITEIRQAQKTVAESELRLKTFIENSPDAFYAIDVNCNILQVNEAACLQTGYSRNELIGMSMADIEAKSSIEEAAEKCKQMDPGDVQAFETDHRRKDGTLFPVDFQLTLININGEKLIFGFARDMTERKAMEREKENYQLRLIQAQKMEAIGTLAGGIAHDFNNLLTGIEGRASLLAHELNPDDSRLEHVNAILKHTQSATDLSAQLLGIARGGKYEVRPLDINELSRESAAMFGRTNKQIRIDTRLNDSPLVVRADRNQLEQVLLNLYINASQAMPEGGEIRLETSLSTLDEGFCAPHGIAPGRYIKISVSDTGTGIAESIQHQIFDPFFTTKEKGRGTGLGLASAYGIIKNHGGIITVHSEVDQGTQFDLYLPQSDQKIQSAPSAGESSVKGSETILLVDDETMITEVGGAMLQKLGYHVISANSGEHAIDIIEKDLSHIQLVILDMIMPGLDGKKTFDQIRRMAPTVPVLLSSGYSMDSKTAEILEQGGNGFIQKPFNMSELSQKVRSILDGVSSPG